MRLIDADALKDALNTDVSNTMQTWNVDMLQLLMIEIDEAPTIEAEPVRHGEWVNPCLNKYGHPCHHCSECGFRASQKDRNYCPHCGAKMDGGAENEG